MTKSLKIVYIWDHSVLSFMKKSVPTIKLLVLALICSVNCTSLVYKLYTFFQTIVDLLPNLFLEVNQKWHIDHFSFSSHLPFQLFIQISKFHQSGLYIITYFKLRRSSIWGILLLESIKNASLPNIYLF